MTIPPIDDGWTPSPATSSPALWAKLKPLARQKRHEPTPAENGLWQRLRSRKLAGLKFRRQHAIERFIVDFYCVDASLVIEVDGPIHDYTPAEDAIRQEYLESLGLRVLRFDNAAVLTDIDSVIKTIQRAAPPSRPRSARRPRP
jgi:very-short-patch-repair endonuclease